MFRGDILVTTPTRMTLKNMNLSPGKILIAYNFSLKIKSGNYLLSKELLGLQEFQEHNPEKTSKYSGNVLLTHPGFLIVTEASPHAANEKAMAIL